MAYAVSATYTVNRGEEEVVASALGTMRELTRQEPACRYYEAHRSLEDPRVFFLYEQYVDEAGFQAHVATDHFSRYIKDEIWPRLEARERLIGRPI